MSASNLDHTVDRLQDRLSGLSLRERKKLKTRRAVQEHALRLFDEQGYDATTVEQIAAAAEISPSTFFRYFPTKEDVVITDEYDPIMAELFRGQPADLSPIEALRATLHEILPLMFDADLQVIRTRLRLAAEVPAVRARMFESMTTGTHAVLTELFSERTGRRPDDPDIAAFTWAILGVLQGAIYRWLDRPDESLADLIDHNLEFLSRGCPL